MNKILKIASLFIAIGLASPVFAQNNQNTFATCLTNNLNGKERKELAKWMFFAMGAHPDIKSYLNATPKNIKDSNESVGNLLTRLLTVDCASEFKTAVSSNDPNATTHAFELVERVAMTELMTNEDVKKSFTGYMTYVDLDKIRKAVINK